MGEPQEKPEEQPKEQIDYDGISRRIREDREHSERIAHETGIPIDNDERERFDNIEKILKNLATRQEVNEKLAKELPTGLLLRMVYALTDLTGLTDRESRTERKAQNARESMIEDAKSARDNFYDMRDNYLGPKILGLRATRNSLAKEIEAINIEYERQNSELDNTKRRIQKDEEDLNKLRDEKAPLDTAKHGQVRDDLIKTIRGLKASEEILVTVTGDLGTSLREKSAIKDGCNELIQFYMRQKDALGDAIVYCARTIGILSIEGRYDMRNIEKIVDYKETIQPSLESAAKLVQKDREVRQGLLARLFYRPNNGQEGGDNISPYETGGSLAKQKPKSPFGPVEEILKDRDARVAREMENIRDSTEV